MTSSHKYLTGLDMTKLPTEAGPVLIALGQSQNGEPLDQLCVVCGGQISVEPQTLRN